MSVPAVFLDKDGTLIADVPYNVDPTKIRLLPGAVEGMRALHNAGYTLVVVTNQSGVARGYFPASALAVVEATMHDLLGAAGVPLAGWYFCPHHPDGTVPAYAMDCDCRKPAPGMLLRAAHDLDLDLTRSWMIGDILNDVEAGHRAGCRAVLVDAGGETEWLPGPYRTPDLTAPDLATAAHGILANAGDEPQKHCHTKGIPEDTRWIGLLLLVMSVSNTPFRSSFAPLCLCGSSFPRSVGTMVDAGRIGARFASLRVLVIGEAMLDRYLHGTADRLCREAPVPVVAVARQVDVPGGAANTAACVAALGATVTFLSVIGDDGEGVALRTALTERGVPTDAVRVQPGRRTLAKNRVVAAGQILVRYDSGDTVPIAPDIEAAICADLAAQIARADAVIVSDYGYGILTPFVRSTLQQVRADAIHPCPLFIDAKDLPAYHDLQPTAIKPNYAEARAVLGLAPPADGDRAAQIATHADALFERTGAAICAVTLDRAGALVLTRQDPPVHVAATATTHGDETRTTGAGDAFGAAFILALAAGGDAATAAVIASAAAGVVVAKEGTATCTLPELQAALAPSQASVDAGTRGVTDCATLLPVLAARQAAGARVVFTNGVFDILHRGHTGLLAAARQRGDLLIVGVNTDASVRRLKGSTRPVNPLDERMAVLAALESVDYVLPFTEGEDTPQHLIAAIRPDVFVKGGDYTRDTLPEAALVESLGGIVEIIPYLPDHSTTRTISRAAQGATIAR